MLKKINHGMIRYIRNNSLLREKLKKIVLPLMTSDMQANIPEITPLNVRATEDEAPRFNILLPSVNQEHVFGGISTALSFFDQLAQYMPIKKRIITTDVMPDSQAIEQFKDYDPVDCHQNRASERQIVGFSDRLGKTIPVGENDYFLATAWWTAFHAQKIVRWQQEEYKKTAKKLVYFIQDFEPGFYPWSSRYALSESTYRFDLPQVAVFNSSMLHTFFKDNQYAFNTEFVFEPVLNEKLKNGLDTVSSPLNKKKQILVYGRPGVERNAFPLIIEALKIWVWQQPGVHDWELISAGEHHPDIDLGHGMVLKSVGKLLLEDYIDKLRESAIGISLMVSPHPSYPPMEMAMFGMGVITNRYANKQLSCWHENIQSIDLSVDTLVRALQDKCDRFAIDNQCFLGGRLLKQQYLESDVQFDFFKPLVQKVFKEDLDL